jgi:hypothetical protein
MHLLEKIDCQRAMCASVLRFSQYQPKNLILDNEWSLFQKDLANVPCLLVYAALCSV